MEEVDRSDVALENGAEKVVVEAGHKNLKSMKQLFIFSADSADADLARH